MVSVSSAMVSAPAAPVGLVGILVTLSAVELLPVSFSVKLFSVSSPLEIESYALISLLLVSVLLLIPMVVFSLMLLMF